MTVKVMNHSEYQLGMIAKSDDALEFIIRDCQEVVRLQPNNPNAGYYEDEIHYACAERRFRKDPKNAPLWWRKAVKKESR